MTAKKADVSREMWEMQAEIQESEIPHLYFTDGSRFM